MDLTVEYRVRPVIRYQVTRHYSESGPELGSCGSEGKGEFPNKEMAIEAMAAFANREQTPSDLVDPSLIDCEEPSISWTQEGIPDTPYPSAAV